VFNVIEISAFARIARLAGSFNNTAARSLASGEPLIIFVTLPLTNSIVNLYPAFLPLPALSKSIRFRSSVWFPAEDFFIMILIIGRYFVQT
jgi:hypothetical protein